ncbi:uncharacterized protein BDV14DRAFT_41385 [Aspergillus stella-maris]|uniref:uncharacterized protein n=1 Tax=Aspergillus stella-maris TaxID=1810926 RepID=UPI003CCCB592
MTFFPSLNSSRISLFDDILTFYYGTSTTLPFIPTLRQNDPQHQVPDSSDSLTLPCLLSPPPRWPGRQFERCVSRSPVTPEACQKILTTFDFERPSDQQSQLIIRELEKCLGYQGWPWINDDGRARFISD